MATKQNAKMTAPEELCVTEGSRNVFADLGFADADDLHLKAELTRQIYRRIKGYGLTQVEAARKLRLKQPDVSRLMSGKYTGFSTERLLSLLTALEVDVEIILRPRERKRTESGTVRVFAEVG
jgi:predicted XRE-type DNA-binding protein